MPVNMRLPRSSNSLTARSTGKSGAVLAAALDFAADADDVLFSGLQVPGQIAVVLFPVRRGHEHLDVLADHLLGGIAEHPFGGGIDRLDDAAGVDGDDRIRRGVQNGLEPFFAGPQRLPRPACAR